MAISETNKQATATKTVAVASQDVPIFLRKTYAMVDTCDTEIATWSDDGETFVVKDPAKFERTIIPQFFKHSKFSSFVRQLNFYSFRKIKYADTIRIDPKLEKETANYWRFRHENFRRGRPDLLSEIKRMNQKTATGANAGDSKAAADPVIKSEVQTLKKRIDEMTKNIDELTAMVQQVSLKQEEHTPSEELSAGQKRKKVDFLPDAAAMEGLDVRPDDMLSSMQLDEIATAEQVAAETVASMPPMPTAFASASRESSSSLSDNEFVDQLFTAFNADGGEEIVFPSVESDASLVASEACQAKPEASENARSSDTNRPDPELMKRLGDALALLPRDIQEMIVNRLIAAIISTDGLDKTPSAAMALTTVTSGKAIPSAVPQSPKAASGDGGAQTQDVPSLPLAAATFAAFFQHHYARPSPQQEKEKNVSKTTIPVIPVHA